MDVKWGFVFVIIVMVENSDCDNFQDTLGHIKPQANTSTQAQAVLDLIIRNIPLRANEFAVQIDSNLGTEGKDTFSIKKENGTVNIIATTGVAAATGFQYYLKYYCNGHISWEASQVNLPDVLPDVDVTMTLNDRFRYYQNVCTTSYSFVWWDWTQWEKHIDWMALNSFNLVLAFNGQEAIWERVYSKLNLTQSDIDEHFTGPAFLSWLRMGNMRGWGGPLSKAWHDRSIYLQKRILQRMRNLGMIPVLPAFAGHLPRAFKSIYPDVNMTKMQVWNSFNDTYCCPYFLDPTEELFKVIGKMFLDEQTAEFGTDHVYNCDSFNEVDPSTSDLTYLSNVGKSIYSAMTAADADAIWVMQGWLFYSSSFWKSTDRAKSFITSVPLGKMIVLDLQSEEFPQYDRLEQYFGQPYIWCMLHDFGGTLGMFGSVNKINEDAIKARKEQGSTMIGTGLTPEGINQNYVIYDLMTESAWRSEPANLTDWFTNYTIRRYGANDEYVIRAWQKLKDSVYDFNGIEKIRGRYAITNTPSLKLNIWTWYEYSEVFDAWDWFIKAADNLYDSPAFLHDLVDVTRQVLQINGDVYYEKLVSSFKAENKDEFKDATEIFKNILSDLELILSTNKDFLLGPWLESAKSCASDSQEEDLFEYNARNQITLWGPSGEIINYANKQWAGVVSHFFQPRWEIFIQNMNKSLETNTKFNDSLVRQEMFRNAEEPFTFDRTIFPMEPTGDTVEIAKQIHERWSSFKSFSRVERSSREEEAYYFQNYVKEDPSIVLIK
ncbi:alpha-N-acetylglucosaminidase isoform X1 [Anoplophora glabripennis]|uniref:alpha-N-acetylglucosaminidase isoform X1 n=1 Tax=Anoplophora glabripennis TaxID=217634 RepID=UPI0008751D65|nr:alpha-N-acetylglucosaminidase isoform X1 [Anoplophora glabripennis]